MKVLEFDLKEVQTILPRPIKNESRTVCDIFQYYESEHIYVQIRSIKMCHIRYQVGSLWDGWSICFRDELSEL